MRKTLASLCLLSILLTQCNMPASPAPVMENTGLPSQPAQSSPTPTFAAEVQPTAVLPTSTPLAALPGQPTAIQFSANGTYADITDTIATGATKTYSIKAIKGQIMSISILPQIPAGDWGYVPMQIKGANGIILCPQSPDSECMFWRGVLPASQDYFVTLTPNGDVPQFVMRVAINPPGTDTQYFQYSDPDTRISLTYPDTFAPAIPVVGNYKSDPDLTLHFIDTEIYDKTNLGEVYLFVSSASDAQIVASCTDPNQNGGGPEQLVGNEVVNAFTFVYSTSEGAGAGNYYEQEIYRMLKKDVCYEVIYFIHYTNIGNYPPGAVTEFDRNAILQRLDSVFSTFNVK